MTENRIWFSAATGKEITFFSLLSCYNVFHKQLEWLPGWRVNTRIPLVNAKKTIIKKTVNCGHVTSYSYKTYYYNVTRLMWVCFFFNMWTQHFKDLDNSCVIQMIQSIESHAKLPGWFSWSCSQSHTITHLKTSQNSQNHLHVGK